MKRLCAELEFLEPIKTPAHPHLLYLMKETIEMPASHSIKLFLGFFPSPGGLPVETPQMSSQNRNENIYREQNPTG